MKKNLIRKRDALLGKFETHCDFLRGSITDVCSTCSRANCICDRKSTRRSYRLTYKDKQQKTKTVYISRSQLGKARVLDSTKSSILSQVFQAVCDDMDLCCLG